MSPAEGEPGAAGTESGADGMLGQCLIAAGEPLSPDLGDARTTAPKASAGSYAVLVATFSLGSAGPDLDPTL
jgi:hypothetical protein